MIEIHKKVFVDDEGNPREVLIPWEEYREIEETLGLDLGPQAVDDLEQARRDRESGKLEEYVDLDDL